MSRRALLVLLVDVGLVAALVYVIQDLQWRSAFASSVHAGTSGYSPSFSYGILTQVFTMTSGSATLTSPVTLDWIQGIVFALVILNLWLVYSFVKARNSPAPAQGPPQTPQR